MAVLKGRLWAKVPKLWILDSKKTEILKFRPHLSCHIVQPRKDGKEPKQAACWPTTKLFNENMAFWLIGKQTVRTGECSNIPGLPFPLLHLLCALTSILVNHFGEGIMYSSKFDGCTETINNKIMPHHSIIPQFLRLASEG